MKNKITTQKNTFKLEKNSKTKSKNSINDLISPKLEYFIYL